MLVLTKSIFLTVAIVALNILATTARNINASPLEQSFTNQNGSALIVPFDSRKDGDDKDKDG